MYCVEKTKNAEHSFSVVSIFLTYVAIAQQQKQQVVTIALSQNFYTPR